MSAILGQGVYTFAKAARLTGLRPNQVREWFRGRCKQAGRRAVFCSDYEPIDGDVAISFLDLLDVYVAGHLREHGVPLQTLRRVYKGMQQDLQTEHPFCRAEMLRDRETVFMQGLDMDSKAALVRTLSHGKVFSKTILPFLKRLDYEPVTMLASKWRISETVVIDPAICLGKPVVQAVSIPTEVLASAYEANHKDADLVADWYGVHPNHVLAAVKFESDLAA